MLNTRQDKYNYNSLEEYVFYRQYIDHGSKKSCMDPLCLSV